MAWLMRLSWCWLSLVRLLTDICRRAKFLPNFLTPGSTDASPLAGGGGKFTIIGAVMGRAVIVVATEAVKLSHWGKRLFQWGNSVPLRGDIVASHNKGIGVLCRTLCTASGAVGRGIYGQMSHSGCREQNGRCSRCPPPGHGSACEYSWPEVTRWCW
jgi:hypothetical protein